MKTRCLIFTIIAALCLGAAAASAADKAWYLGFKPGVLDIDVADLDAAGQGCLEFGYVFHEFEAGSFAIEGDFSTTLDKGDISEPGVTGEWDAQTIGLFGVYKSPGDLYFKGKVGYVDAEADIEARASTPFVTVTQRIEEEDDDVAAGIGAGWKVSEKLAIEIDWTRMFFDEDVDLYTFGVVF